MTEAVHRLCRVLEHVLAIKYLYGGVVTFASLFGRERCDLVVVFLGLRVAYLELLVDVRGEVV